MTMQEYISKVDGINGKYDIVVIGGYEGNIDHLFHLNLNIFPMEMR